MNPTPRSETSFLMVPVVMSMDLCSLLERRYGARPVREEPSTTRSLPRSRQRLSITGGPSPALKHMVAASTLDYVGSTRQGFGTDDQSPPNQQLVASTRRAHVPVVLEFLVFTASTAAF